MTILDNYPEYAGKCAISPSLLWDYDLATFDWWKSRKIVVQRVIERGWLSDFYAALNLYGGINGMREIIKEIPYLSKGDMNFVCVAFDLKKRGIEMLYTNVVAGTTLELLKKLEAEPLLASFNLAGGTALALYLGHRKSVDLDLFTPESFDAEKLKGFLEERYGFRTDFMKGHTLKGSINGVKIDCIKYACPYLRPPYEENGIRLYDMADIIAMKLLVIADNGSRIKDFIDISFLSTRYPLIEMLAFYQKKFAESNVMRPFKALTYFGDIDFEEDIVMLNGDFDWRMIEKKAIDHGKRTGQGFSYAADKCESLNGWCYGAGLIYRWVCR